MTLNSTQKRRLKNNVILFSFCSAMLVVSRSIYMNTNAMEKLDDKIKAYNRKLIRSMILNLILIGAVVGSFYGIF